MAHDQFLRFRRGGKIWVPGFGWPTRKSGRRVTRTDHLRALRQSIARTINHRDPVGFMLFLERCPLRFLAWLSWNQAHPSLGEELEAKWAREAQAERGTDDQASP